MDRDRAGAADAPASRSGSVNGIWLDRSTHPQRRSGGRILGLAVAACLSLTVCSGCRSEGSEAARNAAAAPGQVKDPCDDPDAGIGCWFVHMPSQLAHVMAIADCSEPGQRLILSGTIYRADGRTPYSGVVLYAYHTDKTGHYSKRGDERGVHRWHGHLHGWCRTDDEGRYEIHTIRPARYPSNRIPAHIHVAVREPDGSEPYYINDFVFADDDLVDKGYLEGLRDAGGTGVVTLRADETGTLRGSRDIRLARPAASR
jgi:protocatechuate 3,4-dioxygenase beta subunit